MLEDWIKDQCQLIDWERDAEVGLLTDKISSLSAKSCQSEGLSLLNLEVESSKTVLFGRCCITLQRLDKGQILQCFKVGDEVSLYSPKLRGNAKADSADIYTVMGLISKVAHNKVEMVVDEFDDHLFESPLRMDLRSSQKTHITMKNALSTIQHEGMNHPLVNLLFYPDQCNISLLQPSPSAKSLTKADMWNQHLNGSQQSAIECALNTPSVAIIHGPPGTGKTSTLTELILQAVSRDMKVLVCAPSNIAVDTILGRLADYQLSNISSSAQKRKRGNLLAAMDGSAATVRFKPKVALSMVRIGHPARISAKIMKYALDSIISNDEATQIVKDVRKDIDNLRTEMSKKRVWKRNQQDDETATGVSSSQMKRDQRADMRALQKEARQRERAVVVNVLRRAQVVLATCVGAGSKILKDCAFDMVVIDEAAQGLEAACWVPIMKLNAERGGKVVLAGDHCQLPPTIKSTQAEKGGLGVTLFERIIKDTRFRAVVRLLDTQYRMHWRISEWASCNMYHGAIQSHPSVAHHTLRDIVQSSRSEGGQLVPSVKVPCDGAVSDSENDSDTDSMSGDAVGAGASGGAAAGKTEEEVSAEESQYPVLLLVDTSGLGMLEDSATAGSGGKSSTVGSGGTSHRNFHEAELVKQHVLSLVRAGVKPSQIGVITPYNGQLEVLRELMFPTLEALATAEPDSKSSSGSNSKGGKSAGSLDTAKAKTKVVNPLVASKNGPGGASGGADAEDATVNLEGLEIKTIDGFQGGEKECILLSLVRSNASHTVGFLGEKRRINVAVTRAKRHLAVFCDSDTCSVDRFMCTLLDHMSEHGDHISAQEFMHYSTAPGGYFENTAHSEDAGNGSDTQKKPSASSSAAAAAKGPFAGIFKTTTLQRADFLAALEKLKADNLTPAESSKNAVHNILIPEAAPPPEQLPPPATLSGIVEVRHTQAASAESYESVTARFYTATGVLRFPSAMNSYCRMLVHDCAESLGLHHRSSGVGHQRCIEVSTTEFPPEGSEPLLPAVPSKQAKASKAKPVKVSANTPAAAAACVPLDFVTPLTLGPNFNDEKEGESQSASSASSNAKPPSSVSNKKAPPNPSVPKKPQSQVYMGAGRQSALGRLEKQHEDDMKNKGDALDEDALIEAAIQHNQRLAHLHQYRVPSAAMPNPEKVHSKEKLHSKVAEAALARARGGGNSGSGDGKTAENTTGGLGGGRSSTGNLGGNVFGFTTSTGEGVDSSKDMSAGNSGGGGSKKKKVLKKPPPNFGGGTLGTK